MTSLNPALVLGSYINGLGTIHSLSKYCQKIPIITVDYKKSNFGSYSRHVTKRYVFNNDEDFLRIIQATYKKYGLKPVLFPTGTDYYTDLLYTYYNSLKKISFVPINNDLKNIIMRKTHQHKIAEKIGVSIPKSIYFCKDEAEKLQDIKLPLLIKSDTRSSLDQRFRLSKICNNNDLEIFLKDIHKIDVDRFQASEIIPGPSCMLYTYGSYYHKGKPLGEYVGRKLTQYPENFGVVCIAENKYNRQVRFLGRKLLNHIEFTGISQVEFKYDLRDRQFKLMEINPRSWMWIKLPTECGVNLPLIQYKHMRDEDLIYAENIQNDRSKLFVDLPSVLIKAFKSNFNDISFFLKNIPISTYSILSSDDVIPGPMFLISRFRRRFKNFVLR